MRFSKPIKMAYDTLFDCVCPNCRIWNYVKPDPGPGIRKRKIAAYDKANSECYEKVIDALSVYVIRRTLRRYNMAFREYKISSGMLCRSCEKKKWNNQEEREQAKRDKREIEADAKDLAEWGVLPRKLQNAIRTVQGRFLKIDGGYTYRTWRECLDAARVYLVERELKQTLREFKSWRKDNESNHKNVYGKQFKNEADYGWGTQAGADCICTAGV
jgi:hypothetical protein